MDEMAKRILTRDDGQPVTVRFYRPEYVRDPASSKGAWHGYWSAEGMDDAGPVELHSYGDDSVQALVLALDMADSWLSFHKDHAVVWHEEMGQDLGFQTHGSPNPRERPTEEDQARAFGLTVAELHELRERALRPPHSE
jgi:hypothetical protein